MFHVKRFAMFRGNVSRGTVAEERDPPLSPREFDRVFPRPALSRLKLARRVPPTEDSQPLDAALETAQEVRSQPNGSRNGPLRILTQILGPITEHPHVAPVPCRLADLC